ncbi:MAG TPA: MBL fold metallo-hydrolase [Terriglobia bacterium]|nr:MBL fold metallo-hydrolase [Terriglobia bacterium]
MKIALGALLATSMLAAQTTPDTPEAHVASARAAAGDDYQSLFDFVCGAQMQGGGAAPRGAAPRGAGAGQAGRGTGAGAPGAGRGAGAGAPRAGRGAPAAGAQGGGRGTPDRSTWYAEPVKVFDNLYFFGQSEYSVWALTSSEGVILLDAIFDYSVEEEVDGGMKKLGLDPATIKYAILSHAHPDHFGGGKFLQDKYGTRAIMSAADWDAVERSNGTKPKRDMVATDGQKITLGDISVTMYLTPGHTPGTISSIFQVKDNGKTHTVALWGGMGLNADRESLTNYIASAKRFQEIAKQAGADIILSNHTDWDRSKVNLPILARREPGAPNPYVTSNASVLRYLKVAEECATARIMRLN